MKLPRFEDAITITGTQKHHYFAPLDSCHLEIAEISHSSAERKHVKISKNGEAIIQNSAILPKPVPGSYVVVHDSSKMWVGYVDHQDEEFGDYLIRFLQPNGVRASYTFPVSDKEQCFKSHDQILGTLPNPSLVGGGSRIRYTFPNSCLQALMGQ